MSAAAATSQRDINHWVPGPGLSGLWEGRGHPGPTAFSPAPWTDLQTSDLLSFEDRNRRTWTPEGPGRRGHRQEDRVALGTGAGRGLGERPQHRAGSWLEVARGGRRSPSPPRPSLCVEEGRAAAAAAGARGGRGGGLRPQRLEREPGSGVPRRERAGQESVRVDQKPWPWVCVP